MTDAATTAVAPIDPAMIADAARAPVQKPEGLTAEAGSVLPPPHEKPKMTTPQTLADAHAQHASNDNDAITEDLLQQAEATLSSALVSDPKTAISPDLRKGLMLTIKYIPTDHNGVSLELCFKGDVLNKPCNLLGKPVDHKDLPLGKDVLMGEVMPILREHPQFKPLFASDKTTPHASTPHGMMHVRMDHLSSAQAMKILNELAQAQQMAVKAEHPVATNENHGAHHAVAESHPPGHGPAHAPPTTVQKPVAALEKLAANNNEIAREGVAL